MFTNSFRTDSLSEKAVASGLGKIERTVHAIINSSHANMGRMPLKNLIQGNYQHYVSPFFIFDEFGPMQLAKGVPFRVDAHPHAGIIPTTYLLKGSAHHRDSLGNDFTYGEGDFIQFTAGSGALHMEETGAELFKNGGVFHGIQSWLNIPAKLKKAAPSASHYKNEDIAVIEKQNIRIKVLLGEIFGVKSRTQLLMPVLYLDVTLNENTDLELPIQQSHNAFVYLLDGNLEVQDARVLQSGQAVLYEREGDFIKLKAKTVSRFLVLGGEANDEPYVAQGPFVLNSEQELQQAYLDYGQGKFGDAAKTNGTRR